MTKEKLELPDWYSIWASNLQHQHEITIGGVNFQLEFYKVLKGFHSPDVTFEGALILSEMLSLESLQVMRDLHGLMTENRDYSVATLSYGDDNPVAIRFRCTLGQNLKRVNTDVVDTSGSKDS